MTQEGRRERKIDDHNAARIAYYQKLTADLTRYRNFRWYIPVWTVSFLGAAAALGDQISQEPSWVRIGAAVAILLVAVVSVVQLWFCYQNYAEHRKAVRDIERDSDFLRLGLPEWEKSAEPKSAQAILPRIHKVFRVLWVLLIALVALYALYAVWGPEPRHWLERICLWLCRRHGA